ncbi:unnamed protein product [Rotaria sordida]|uniref:CW-type domain-containing protein n=1 Tax=Rotaria sordida TaxID=392033 RepID=A0A818TQ75_9BILA|nr:unnamed protein product [Rotaria sordida]CAF3689843.1 unnamed protein product [Rotaria sordida]
MEQYDCLNKAQLSFEYLHTNSTTHTFLFGALAELVDNSRDAGARNLDIYTCKDPSLRGGFYLAFLDDGCGMHYDDVFNVIVFGKSAKRHAPDSNQIGQYGNGLKSGAMRIANDFILFTKKDNIGTCLFLSRSFHQEEHISQVICPMPCFDLRTQQPIQNTDYQQLNGTRTYTFDKAKHEVEMRLIKKYSPFKTIDDLFKQFNLITSSSGTLIVLYNVKLSDTGEPELDIKTDPYDMLIDSKNRRNLFDDDDENIPFEYRSLRAYVSILYYEPRMRIAIQRRRVITKRLPHTLYKPRQYQFKSTRFKTRSEQEIKKCEKELDSLEERKREADSQVHHLQQSIGVTTSIEERSRLRKLQVTAAELKDMTTRLRNGLARKKSEMNTTKTLTFIFGLNIQNRASDGVFVYNCGRLIKMYEKLGQPNKKTVYCRGVVGVVDIPSIVLEPTHNKQSFADEKEYHFLLKNMGEYMRQYWSDAGIENYVKEFWETYGYRDDQLDRPPSNDPEVVKRRQAAVPMLIQCDKCLKWRRLPYASNTPALTQAQLEAWRCSDNTDVMNNTCSTSEKLEIIPEGELKQKPQATNTQNRTSGKVTSPPPTSSSSSSSLTTRSSGTNKRISNGEISSTTAVANSKSRSSRSNVVPKTIIPQKRSLPQSRSLSGKSKGNKKRKQPSSQKTKTKNRNVKSDNEEVEEEEEEEEKEDEKEEEEEDGENKEEDKEELSSPINRRTRGQSSAKPSKTVQKTPPPTPTRSSRTSKKTQNQTTPSDSVTSTNNVNSIDDDTNNNETIDNNDTNINGRLPPPTIGARVMAMYQGAQRTGKVLNVNDKRGIFKMRFDEFPTAEFDYSFSYKSPAWSYVATPPAPSSSSTTTETTKNDNEPLFSIVRKFKALIKFMLPPDWDLTREQITSMSYDELSRFDVELFMQSYREKMTQIVEQRKADEARWRTSAQRIQAEVTELLNLTGMPISIDSSMDDFEQHIQDYITQAEKRQNASS